MIKVIFHIILTAVVYFTKSLFGNSYIIFECSTDIRLMSLDRSLPCNLHLLVDKLFHNITNIFGLLLGSESCFGIWETATPMQSKLKVTQPYPWCGAPGWNLMNVWGNLGRKSPDAEQMICFTWCCIFMGTVNNFTMD